MPKKKKTKKKVKKKIASKKAKETIYKTQKDWISKAIVNKSQYLKKYNQPLNFRIQELVYSGSFVFLLEVINKYSF